MGINTKRLRGALLLFTASVIWGAAFVAQSEGMKYIGPFTFVGVRFTLGGLAVLAVALILSARRKRRAGETPATAGTSAAVNPKRQLFAGAVCGTALFAATSLQQIGMIDAEVGKSGFITALYMLFVPIFGLFMRKKTDYTVWIGVGIAVAGMWLLCITPASFGMEKSDLYLLGCAAAFGIQILCVDRFSADTEPVMTSALQFLFCGILGLITMFIFETPKLSEIMQAAWPILYAALGSTAVGFTFQVLAQRDTPPALASLMMSFESVVAAVCGWVILREAASGREIVGACLVFAAILIAQIQIKKRGATGCSAK